MRSKSKASATGATLETLWSSHFSAELTSSQRRQAFASVGTKVGKPAGEYETAHIVLAPGQQRVGLIKLNRLYPIWIDSMSALKEATALARSNCGPPHCQSSCAAVPPRIGVADYAARSLPRSVLGQYLFHPYL